MAYSKTYTPKVTSAAQRVISGSFAPDGANAPTTVKGDGFTVAWSATGIHLITVEQPVVDFVSIVPSLQIASADGSTHQVTVGAVSASGRTFQICHKAAADEAATEAALADLTAAATTRINFVCVVAESDVPGAAV
jgi:hypothetical protein